MNKITIFLSGAFGGVAPNMLNQAMSLTQGGELPEWTFLIGIIIFGLMGAVVVGIWGEKELKRAFYLGIGLPALIQVGGNSIDAKIAAVSFDGSRFALISSAYAQNHPVPGRTLTVNATDNSSSGNYVVELKSGNAGAATSQNVSVPTTSPINVPDHANTVTLKIANSFSNELQLPTTPNTSMTINVTRESQTWSGLKKSFGIKNVPQYRLHIEVQ